MNGSERNTEHRGDQGPKVRDALEIVGISLVIGLLLLFLPRFGRDSYAYPLGHPPLPPTYLKAEPGVNNVELTWYPSISHGMKGYLVYRGESAANPDTFALANAEPVVGDRWVDYGTHLPLESETDYFYCLRSVDILDQESATCSNISNARPETPTDPPDPVQTGKLRIFMPDSGASQGETITVPVKVGNADGLMIESMDVWVTYNPNVITATQIQRASLLVDYGYAFDSNIRGDADTGAASAVIIVPYGGEKPVLYGEATLFEVAFTVRGTEGMTTLMSLPLTFTVDSTLYGTTIYTDVTLPDIPLIRDHGVIKGNCEDAMIPDIPLIRDHGVFTVTLDDPNAPSYLLGDVDTAETGDGVIDAADVTTAMGLAVGKKQPNHRQRQVGDLNGDERINSADVALIQRKVHGLHTVMTARDMRWLRSHMAGAGHDVVTITLGSAAGLPGGRVELPVTVQSTGPIPDGWDLQLNYDPAWLTLADINPQPVIANWHSEVQVTEVPTETESRSAKIALVNNQPSFSFVRDRASGLAVRMDGAQPLGPAATGMVLRVGFDVSPGAPSGATPVTLVGARATDAFGQDFASSNLQIKVVTDSGFVSIHRVYLPLVLRQS